LLRNRLLSALILISSSLVFVSLDAWAYNFGCPGLWILPLGVYLIFGSAVECSSMVSRSRFGNVTWPAVLGCAAVMTAGSLPVLLPLLGSNLAEANRSLSLEWSLLTSIIVLVFCFVWHFGSFVPGQGIFVRCVLSGWIACYFGIAYSCATAVRISGDSGWGLYYLIGIVVVTKFSDSGAYFFGRSMGRLKLCREVSPNKTVEGLLGGMLSACLAAWVYFGVATKYVFESGSVSIGWLGILVIGIGFTLAGLAGDLLQSVFKREMGYKDSGRLLPGLGGLWDVTDSLLPSIVVGYIVARSGWVVGPGQ
jgi:phosphatidate cytidylyltransferase